MSTASPTVVTFIAAGFNTTDSRPEFINPENFGDDVARVLMERLRGQGVSVDPELGQEDYGWYFSFTTGGREYDFLLGLRDGELSEWVGWLESGAGFFASLFGARKRGVQPEAVRALDAALSALPSVRDVRWHLRADFDSGREERGIPGPLPDPGVGA
ncbi:MAG: hypothetical protein ACK47B_13500 [Armatimonadota bacterium]